MSETLTAKREGVVAVLPGTVEEAQFEQIYCPGCQHARDLETRVAKLEAAYKRLRRYVKFRAELAP